MADGFDPYKEWLGIPSEEQPPNHYRLLGVRPYEDLPSIIKTAVDERTAHIRRYQLSQHANRSQDLLNEVAAAWVCLSNPEKKAAYDAWLRAEQGAGAAGTPPPLRTAGKRSAEATGSDSRRARDEAVETGSAGWGLKVGILAGSLALATIVIVAIAVALSGNEPEIATGPEPPAAVPPAPEGTPVPPPPTPGGTTTPPPVEPAEIPAPGTPPETGPTVPLPGTEAVPATEDPLVAGEPPATEPASVSPPYGSATAGTGSPVRIPTRAEPPVEPEAEPGANPFGLPSESARPQPSSADPFGPGPGLPSGTAGRWPTPADPFSNEPALPAGASRRHGRRGYGPLASRGPSYTLPGGRTFRPDEMAVRADTLADLIGDSADEAGPVLVLHSTEGFSVAYVRQSDGDLSGDSIAYYDNDKPMQYAQHRDNQRDGLLKLWDRDGRRVLWRQYSNGNPDGVSCLFEEDDLVALGVWEAGVLAAMVLVEDGQVVAELQDAAAVAANAAAKAVIAKIEELEEQIRETERVIKMKVRGEIRDRVKRERFARAAELNPSKRAAAQARINQRSAERSSHLGALKRQSGL